MFFVGLAIFITTGLPTAKPVSSELRGSRSPDGRYTILYEAASHVPPHRSSRFWIVRRSDWQPVSAQLVPTKRETQARTEEEARKNAPAQERQLLFDIIAQSAEAEAGRAIANGQHREVIWLRNGTRVKIRGGAHKFSYVVTYEIRDGEFRLIKQGVPTMLAPDGE